MADEYFSILLRIANRCKDFLRLVCNRVSLSFNFIFSYSTIFLFPLSSVFHVSFEIFPLFRVLFFYIAMLTFDIFERVSDNSFSIVHTLHGLSFQKESYLTRTHHLICMRQTDDLAAVAHSDSKKKRKGSTNSPSLNALVLRDIRVVINGMLCVSEMKHPRNPSKHCIRHAFYLLQH
jgi:hypothetical protein